MVRTVIKLLLVIVRWPHRRLEIKFKNLIVSISEKKKTGPENSALLYDVEEEIIM